MRDRREADKPAGEEFTLLGGRVRLARNGGGCEACDFQAQCVRGVIEGGRILCSDIMRELAIRRV